MAVWCEFWSRSIIGQFFLEYEQGDRYRAMLNEFMFTKIEEEDISNIWFQQDDATCHIVEATLDVLRTVFKDQIISRRANLVWPPRSWDLTPLDYYLWVPSKISVKPPSQRQWRFKRTIFVKPLVKYSWTQSTMCLKIEPIV